MTRWVGEAGLVFIRKEVGVRLDVAVIISGFKVAMLIHTEEGLRLVFDVVNKEDAVQVVNFVEQGAGEVVFGSQADFGAVFEERLDLDLFGAGDQTVEFGDGEAAFVVGLGFAVGFDDFGVDEGGEGVFGLVLKIVADDDDALVDAKLGGGHGGGELIGMLFFPFQGSGGHIGDDLVGFVGDVADAARFLAQAGVRGGDDGFEGGVR